MEHYPTIGNKSSDAFLQQKVLIKGATILSMTGPQDIISQGDIAIEQGKILAVGQIPSDFIADRIIEAEGMLAMPGFINCHTHAAMTLLRSYADDLPLMEWLSTKIWPLEENLVPEDIYWGTMLSFAEMLRSGTTTFLDMYFHMDQVAKAAEEVGIRAVLSRGMISFGPSAEAAISQSRELVKEWHGKADGRITVMLGPHAPYTCSPDYLKRVMELADELGIGIHIHLAETENEISEITEKYGKRPIELMNSIGLFDGRHVVAAHCVHLTDEEIAVLAEKQVGVAHNPESNMKLASGIAPVPKMLAKGVRVGIGTDGASSNNNLDMLQETRSAALLHKVNQMDATVLPAYQALEMATVLGAQALGLKEVGQLVPGYIADIILFDLEKPHLYPRHDLVANLVYAAQASDVDTVLVDGNILMERGILTTIDEKAVLKKAQEVTDALLARSKK